MPHPSNTTESRSPASGPPEYRVIVAGGGPAGLSAALALAKAGVETVLVTALLPAGDAGTNARSAALFPGSLALLDNLGVLCACLPASAPLAAIRLVDDTGGLLRAPEVTFSAAEIGEPRLGYNIPNGALTAALQAALAIQPGLTWISGATITALETDADSVRVLLADGRTIPAALVVAADGRQSVCRAGAGIAATQRPYDQTAVTASFTHGRAHDGVSTEFHGPAGPCTTVPLPGHASALVWIERPPVAARIVAMDDAAFGSALEKRLQGLLGRVLSVSPRAQFPLTWMQADTYAARRVMLIGEAAHVMPPIGAQGLNLGLRDVACMVDCVTSALAQRRDPGGHDALAAYNVARAPDIGRRMTAVDGLNRSLLSELLPVRLARGLGLHALAALGPLRRRLMQEGLRPSHIAPLLMQSRDVPALARGL